MNGWVVVGLGWIVMLGAGEPACAEGKTPTPEEVKRWEGWSQAVRKLRDDHGRSLGGLIVDVEAQTAIEDVVVADESALAGYRTWLEINDPLLATDLFTNGAMRLDAEPAIEAHRTNVEQYLARATS